VHKYELKESARDHNDRGRFTGEIKMATNNNNPIEITTQIKVNDGQPKCGSSCESRSFMDRSREALARMGSALHKSGRALDKTGRAIAAGGRASTRMGRVMGGSRLDEQTPEVDSRRAPVNIYETQEEYKISLELPGCTEDTITVTREGYDLWVKAWNHSDLQESTNTRMYMQEKKLGNWHRHIHLGRDIDTEGRITAKCCNGVLVISLPKKAHTQHRNIHVDLV